MVNYSKMISVLKFFSFFSAISILTVLFVVSPPNDFGAPVSVSTSGLEDNISYQIIDATLRGVTEEGHRFAFKADSIDPDPIQKKNFSLHRLHGTISLFENDVFTISATKAFLSSTEKNIELSGKLNINTESGLSARSEKILVDFDKYEFLSPNAVELSTPIGTITGGKMKIFGSDFITRKPTYVYLEKGVKVVLK